jgi:CHAT domain-containing protein/tetratricopeptide (TPR) repeat protein
MTSPTATLLAAVCACSMTVMSSTPQDPATLHASETIVRPLAHGQTHRYQLALDAGDYAHAIVEQRGIDLVVQVLDPQGTVIGVFQDEIRKDGDEQVEIVAGTTGTYTISVAPAEGIIAPGAYAIHLESRRVATEADRTLQEAHTLRAAGTRLFEQENMFAARPLLERALQLTEGVRGPDDLQVARLTYLLARVYTQVPETAKADTFFQRTLAIMDARLGADHPATAIVRARLARQYWNLGQRPQAAALNRQALAVIEKTLGTEHVAYVNALLLELNLAIDASQLNEALAIGLRQQSILEKIDDADSLVDMYVLTNIGGLYCRKQDYVRAKDVLYRALALGEKLLGPDSWALTAPIGFLGIVSSMERDYVASAAYFRRVLSIEEHIAGPDNPNLDTPLLNLGNAYHSMGDYPRALAHNLRALDVEGQAYGPLYRRTLFAVANVAKIYTALGDIPHAIGFQRRLDAMIEATLRLNLTTGSEREKLLFMTGFGERTGRAISLHLDTAPADPDAAALAALVILQRKGRVLDAMTDIFAGARQRATDPRERDLIVQLQHATADLAQLALSADDADPAARQTRLTELESRTERLEAQIGEPDAEFRAQMQPVTLEAVQAAIPATAALVELIVFRPFDPAIGDADDPFGAPRYAAYVIRKEGAPRGFDLGPASTIDAAVGALRQALGDPRRRDLRPRARALEAQVLQPLRASLGHATRLLISPDGDLNLVPFEALIDEHGHYLIERYAITYLTSGRDLLRLQVPRASHSAPVIVANPLYGEPVRPSSMQPADTPRRVRTASRRSVTTSENLSSMYFAPLIATATEARMIKALFPPARLLTGSRATKAAVQRVDAPIVLHIASHGFFLRRPAGAPVENPLLRSGLALAGANLAHDPQGGGGILTALEAAGLNLWGTKLATLSACDTGVGEVRNGEGVYGLRRAFVLAGAETLVMSLWPVSDALASDIMTTYYTGLRAGRGRGDALRQAQLAMLKRPGRRHPYYWASFIQSGEWANLAGRR